MMELLDQTLIVELLNQPMIIALLNKAIIISIVVGFMFFGSLELGTTFLYFRSFNSTKSLLKWLASNPEVIKEEEIKKNILNVLLDNFLINDELKLHRRSDRLLLTTSVSSLIPSLPSSSYRFTPALLTTTGVLGTFVGISIGLSDFSSGSIGNDSSQLMASASTLLEGMKTAFYTSLTGMFFSILFMILLFICAKWREIIYKRYFKKLSARCMTVSPVSLLHNLEKSDQQGLFDTQLKAAQATILSNKQQIETSKGLAKAFQEFNSTRIIEGISEAIQVSISTEVTPILAKISTELEHLQAIKNITEATDNLSNKIEKVTTATIESNNQVISSTEKFAGFIDEFNASKVVSTLSQALNESISTEVVPVLSKIETQIGMTSITVKESSENVAQLSGNLTKMMSVMGETTNSLNHFQQDTLTRLQNFAESLKEILTQFQTNTQQVLSDVGLEINNAIEQSVKGMESQRVAFENSASRASIAFNDQNTTLETLGKQSSILMDSSKNNLLEGLSEIDEKVKNMSSVVQGELEMFRDEYQNNLSSFFSKQANLLEETLGEQRDGLAGVVEQFRVTFKEENTLRESQFSALNEQYAQLQKGVIIVDELIEAVGINKATAFTQLQDATQSIGSQVGKLRKEYAEASERFNKLTERMPEAMNEYFLSSKQNNEIFFSSFDEAAALVHGKLAEAANLLVTAMQQIELQNGSTKVET